MKRFSFAMAVCLVACASEPIGTDEATDSVALEATAPPPDNPDGEVDRSEICAGGLDLLSQPNFKRPFGGVVRVSSTLPASRLALVRQAASARATATGGQAIWRVIQDAPGNEGAITNTDAVLLASCSFGQQGTLSIWNWRKGTGGVGVAWTQFATDAAAVAAIGGALFGQEGVPAELAASARDVAPDAPSTLVGDVPTARLYLTAARDYLNLGLSEIAGDDPDYWDPGTAAEQATDGLSMLQTSLTYLPTP